MTKVCGVEISNPDKIISDNIKKIDMINYYKKISQKILPYLENRFISEVRCHGNFENCFFRKHPADNEKKFITINSKEDLILEAQLGSIELHPWGCKKQNPNKPDIMIFDLDPDENMNLKTLRKCVLLLKQVLDDLNLTSFLKASGGKGYHVLLPFKESHSWQKFSKFSKNIALLLESSYPNLFTTNIRKSERKGKIFVDYLRNKKGATCVAPYSLRARENLPVSLPLDWKDLNRISPNQVKIKNVENFLSKNPWKDFFLIEQSLN